MHLVSKANHKDGRWQGIEIKRGQLITGRKTLKTETGISEQSIRTCLSNLKSTNEVTIQSTKHYSVITICNYERYQGVDNQDQPSNQPANQPTPNQRLTTNKNDKNDKQDTLPLSLDITASKQEEALKVKKTTWLTPYNDIWFKHFQADLPFKQAGKALQPLLRTFNQDEICRGLDNYLKKVEPKFATITGFASKAGAYISQPKKSMYDTM
jgi:hypothetical protein